MEANVKSELLGSIARGYCSERNERKVLDPELCEDIAYEVEKNFFLRLKSEPESVSLEAIRDNNSTTMASVLVVCFTVIIVACIFKFF